MKRMIYDIDPATIIVVIVLLIIEAILLFSIFRHHYHKKLSKHQKQFAGYLKYLDEENHRLKGKNAKKK